MKQDRHPVRRVLYGLYGLMVVLLFAQASLPVSTGWHQVMELGVVGTTVGLMAWWQRRNAAVLEDDALLRKLEHGMPQRRQYPLTPVQARYLVAQERHAMRHRAANSTGASMGTIVSLSTPNLDWAVLTRVVEMGTPIWLELDGTIQGVLLPTTDAHRLLGQYMERGHERAAVRAPVPAADQS